MISSFLLLMETKKEPNQWLAPESIELISLRPTPYHGPPMPRQSSPRLRTVTIKGKEFHQVSIPQPGGGRRLRTLRTETKPGDSSQPFRMRSAGWLCTSWKRKHGATCTARHPKE